MRVLALLLGLLLVCACEAPTGGAGTVEEAIEQHVAATKQELLEPIMVKARLPVAGDVLTLYNYAAQVAGRRQSFTCLKILRQEHQCWRVREEAGYCLGWAAGYPRQPLEAFDLTPGGFGPNDIPSVYTGGLVSDPAVRQVVLRFHGAPAQSVPIQNGAYLVVIPTQSGFSLTTIELLDDRGAVRYRKTFP